MTVELTPAEAWLLIAVLTWTEKQPPVDVETVAIQKALAHLRQWRSALLQAYLANRVQSEPNSSNDEWHKPVEPARG